VGRTTLHKIIKKAPPHKALYKLSDGGLNFQTCFLSFGKESALATVKGAQQALPNSRLSASPTTHFVFRLVFFYW